MTRKTSYLVALVLGAGCTEYTMRDDNKGIDDLTGDGVPIIVVSPSVVDFATVEVTEGMEKVEVVTVSNAGDDNLRIDAMYMDDATGPFSFTLVNSLMLPPGQNTQFEVTYLPTTSSEDEGYVYLDSNDPATPTAQVKLMGTGVAPIIEVDPLVYDFGNLWVGCDAVLPVEVRNVGSSDLVVYSFTFSTASTDMAFTNVTDTNGDEPGLFSLAPWESMDVFVSYAPYDEYDDVAYLAVASNDPLTPRVQATQTGAGAFFGYNTDIYEQPSSGMTDIIFAVDKSGSMYGEISSVLANFETFVTTLAGLDADFQVAATVLGFRLHRGIRPLHRQHVHGGAGCFHHVHHDLLGLQRGRQHGEGVHAAGGMPGPGPHEFRVQLRPGTRRCQAEPGGGER
jgi:hypothetical protein